MYFRFGFVQYTIVLAPASEGGGTTKFTSDLDSTLSSLPLYDGGLYERFGHDVYVRALRSRGEERHHHITASTLLLAQQCQGYPSDCPYG